MKLVSGSQSILEYRLTISTARPAIIEISKAIFLLERKLSKFDSGVASTAKVKAVKEVKLAQRKKCRLSASKVPLNKILVKVRKQIKQKRCRGTDQYSRELFAPRASSASADFRLLEMHSMNIAAATISHLRKSPAKYRIPEATPFDNMPRASTSRLTVMTSKAARLIMASQK